jgi:type II secretory pathway predicted ATPase ExeA
MYESFFGLSQRPFAFAPLANRYFPASSVDAARQVLARIIDRGEGAGLLIGAPGTGKTLLLHVLAEQFAERFGVVLLRCGHIASRRELWQAVLFELKLPYQGLDEGELRLLLTDYALRGDAGLEGLLLLVDEAHTLPVPLLEELRMVTNLARRGEPLVRLVLSGTMSLEEQFAHPRLEAFAQRLAARCYLEPFDRAETSDYVRFQIAVAGGQAESVFAPDAYDTIYRATGGVPRLVNQLCDHALLQAYTDEQRPIGRSAIEEAWSDLQQLPTQWSSEPSEPSAAARPERAAGIVEFGELTDDPPADAAPAAARRDDSGSRWPSAAATMPCTPEPTQLAAPAITGPARPAIPTPASQDTSPHHTPDENTANQRAAEPARREAASTHRTSQPAESFPAHRDGLVASAPLDVLQQQVGSLIALDDAPPRSDGGAAGQSSAPPVLDEPVHWFGAERDDFEEEQPLLDHYAALDAQWRNAARASAQRPQTVKGSPTADRRPESSDEQRPVRLQVIVDPYADLDDGHALDDDAACRHDGTPQSAASLHAGMVGTTQADGSGQPAAHGAAGPIPSLPAMHGEAACTAAAGAQQPAGLRNDPYAFDLPVFDGAEELIVADHYAALQARAQSRAPLRPGETKRGAECTWEGRHSTATCADTAAEFEPAVPRCSGQATDSTGRKAQVVPLQRGVAFGAPGEQSIVVQDAPERPSLDESTTLAN